MKNIIDHITEIKGKITIIEVYYKSGRHRRFTENDNLPLTVLDKYLNGNAVVDYKGTTLKVTKIY